MGNNKFTFTSEEIRTFVSRPLFDPEVLCSRDQAHPKISVVIPSYNQAQFLERTLLSILNQNYPNTELIVIDGGSQDGSVALIKKYEPYLAYWVSEPDQGQPSAINEGFSKASGDLICWQNSDDLYLPGFFSTVAESCVAHGRAQLFIGNIYLINEDDHIVHKSRFPPFSVSHLLYLNWNLSSQAVFLRRQLVDQVGPLREDIQVGFDWDWFIRVGKAVKKKHIVLHRQYGGCYRIHQASKLSSYASELRWPIEVQILRSHGVRVREELSFQRQPWRQRLFLKTRMFLYSLFLYQNFPRSRRLRFSILSLLARYGTICKGFE